MGEIFRSVSWLLFKVIIQPSLLRFYRIILNSYIGIIISQFHSLVSWLFICLFNVISLRNLGFYLVVVVVVVTVPLPLYSHPFKGPTSPLRLRREFNGINGCTFDVQRELHVYKRNHQRVEQKLN